MRISFRPEPVDDGFWIIRRYVNNEKDIIVQHKPFATEFEARQFCRILMRNVKSR